MGMIFYRLVLTNGFILSLQEVMQALVMTYCFGKPPQMDAAKFFVNIVDTQVSKKHSWWVIVVFLVGFSMARKCRRPFVAPLWCAFKCDDVLYQVLVGVERLWSSSYHLQCFQELQHAIQLNTTWVHYMSFKTHSFFLVALLFCALPITSLLYEERDICGPNPGTRPWSCVWDGAPPRSVNVGCIVQEDQKITINCEDLAPMGDQSYHLRRLTLRHNFLLFIGTCAKSKMAEESYWKQKRVCEI